MSPLPCVVPGRAISLLLEVFGLREGVSCCQVLLELTRMWLVKVGLKVDAHVPEAVDTSLS